MPPPRPTPDDTGGSAPGESLRWLVGLARPYRVPLTLAFVAMAVTGAVGLLIPQLAARAVDAVLVEHSVDGLRRWILGLIALYVLVALFDYLETYLLRSSADRLLRSLRARLHGHLLGLSPSFFERERVGELISRLGNDIASIGDVLTGSVVGGAQQALTLVGALALMTWTHPALTGVMLLAIPPIAIAAVIFGRRIEALAKRRTELVAASTVTAEEALAGIRTVQSFTREAFERQRYGRAIDAVLALSLRLARLWGAFHAVVSLLAFSAITLVIWYGAGLLLAGELTPGQLMGFVLYTFTAGAAVASLTSVWGGLASAAGATQRVRQLLATRSAVAEPAEAVRLAAPRAFAFEGVGFAYPSKPDQPALEDFTVRAAPGDVIALVGASGAGKSTVASLLVRFYDPQHGAVTVDDVDVRRLPLADLRRAIGYVSQDVFLFGGTVAENLRYGKPDAGPDELREAARAAQALEFIDRLPDGFDTVLGERGVRLSAGERQRIAIARVLLSDPRIVILDEATSALDAASEQAVGRAFERLLEGRTTLVIAHRLATVRRASRVLVLERGRIIEEGVHDDLVRAGGAYQRLCSLQMLV